MNKKPLISSSRKPRVFWVPAIATGLIVSIYFISSCSRVDPEDTTSSKEKVSSKSIACLGRLEPEGGVIKVTASPIFGSPIVRELMIKDGDSVNKDQPIAVLDSKERLEAILKEAESKVKVAQNRLDKLKASQPADIAAQQAEVERWEAELKHAETNFSRYEKLYDNKTVSASELDSYRMSFDTKKQQLQWAKELLSKMTAIRPIDIQLAKAELEEAQAIAEKAKAELALATVRSSINGRVIKIHAHAGEKVGEQGIAELGNTSQMYVTAEVYETDIGKVKIGQKATITSDALSGPVEGVVERIGYKVGKNEIVSTDPAQNTDTRVIEVKIKLLESQSAASLTHLQVQVKINS